MITQYSYGIAELFVSLNEASPPDCVAPFGSTAKRARDAVTAQSQTHPRTTSTVSRHTIALRLRVLMALIPDSSRTIKRKPWSLIPTGAPNSWGVLSLRAFGAIRNRNPA